MKKIFYLIWALLTGGLVLVANRGTEALALAAQNGTIASTPNRS